MKDIKAGYDVSLQLLSEVVDFLQVLGLKILNFRHRSTVAMRGVYGPGLTSGVALSSDLGWSMEMKRSGWSVELKKADPTHLAAFSDLLGKSSPRTQIEECIATSVHWLAKAASNISEPNQLLFSWTALESLFSNKDRGIDADTVCERVAFLLHSRKKARKFIYKRLTKVKQIRNSIIHRGNNRLLDDEVELLAVAKWAAYYAIQEILKLSQDHNIQTLPELDDYFDDLRFA